MKMRDKLIKVLFCVVYFFMAQVLLGQRSQAKISQQLQDIDALKKQRSHELVLLEKAEAVQVEWKSTMQNLGQKLTDEEQMSEIVSHIGNISRSASVSLNDVKPQQVQHENFYNTFTVELAFEAEMKSLVQFLYGLQSNPNSFAIEELQIEESPNQNLPLKCYLAVSRILIPS